MIRDIHSRDKFHGINTGINWCTKRSAVNLFIECFLDSKVNTASISFSFEGTCVLVGGISWFACGRSVLEDTVLDGDIPNDGTIVRAVDFWT